MVQCFWNPYAPGADYKAIWAEAKAFEGRRVRVVDRTGALKAGVCRLATVCIPGPGIGVAVVDRGYEQWIGGDFQAIELEPGQ